MTYDAPLLNQWLLEAKSGPEASKIGMILTHNGIVRRTTRASVRDGENENKAVIGMNFSYDHALVNQAVLETRAKDGIYFVKVWLNEGLLQVGDDLMYIMVGGDIRTRTMDALNFLLDRIKAECVTEIELTQ